MARSTGTMKLSSNFEPRLGAPLDGRMVVPTLADLTTSGNFPYPYKGMIVAVQATCKLYVYNGGTITSSSSWQEVGGSSLSGNVGNTSTPIYLNNGVLNAVAAKFLSANSTGETAITDGQDLNEFVTIGVYGTSGGNTGSSVAGSLLNKPTFAGGFRMYVESCGGDMTYLRQTIITKAGLTFTRTSISLTASPKTWTDWKQIATLSDIPATPTLASLMGSSAKGSTTQPIYWNGSAFANTSYTLGKSVPSDAVFTDTNTHRPIQMNGTEILGNNTTALNLKAGSNVSLSNSSGTVTIAATDTNTWRGIQDNLTSSTNTTESLSAKQGYLLANGSARDSTKLPLAGGTMTGTLVAKGSVYTDARDQGTLNMNNSNIYGVNAIYMADSSDNAGEGINFINSSTTLDTLWASGGVLLFTPNRADGTATTAANSQKVGRFTVNPTSGQVVITDGTSGGIKSSGYTIAKSVPSNAVFTDNNTTYTLSTSGNTIVLTPSSGTANTITVPYATSAGTASKLGSSSTGNTKGIYLSAGSPVVLNTHASQLTTYTWTYFHAYLCATVNFATLTQNDFGYIKLHIHCLAGKDVDVFIYACKFNAPTLDYKVYTTNKTSSEMGVKYTVSDYNNVLIYVCSRTQQASGTETVRPSVDIEYVSHSGITITPGNFTTDIQFSAGESTTALT